ncbi:hypothetical protein [Chryseolinea soli]|uniref:Uncharacterized protein n=1 Tax=Chryseolinea soli TaxID=2321403 RepID=A0A385SI06_9BACT|nr:hypothetical protein [Chryseolinea soli]AYB30091.1 hypothetical protein D4L85_05640 [Chryseolinea soli]
MSLLALALLLTPGCSTRKREAKEEQIRIESPAEIKADSNLVNAIQGNMAPGQIATTPQEVLLTGLDQHRLVTIYKERRAVAAKGYNSDDYLYGKRSYDYESDREEHYMPGLDLLYGYNLLNIAHYDLKTETLNPLFEQPVLIKSLYYPSFIQDSLYEKPITRDYYLLSVYDADTNQDTLINRRDLRRFYYFDATGKEKIQLLPSDHSAVRSQYDPKNDVMYIFARQDADHDGSAKSKEPLHIFWVSLKTPRVAKRLY